MLESVTFWVRTG